MKLLFKLSLVFVSVFILTSCNSTDSKAERLFKDVFDYAMQKSGENAKLKYHEIIYSAPNDSLSIIEFTSSVEGIGTETMYFAYVVSDEDYWVMLMNNPVENAKTLRNNLNSISNTSNKENDEKLLYSAIRLNCSMKYYGGGGKTVKDTEAMLKEEK